MSEPQGAHIYYPRGFRRYVSSLPDTTGYREVKDRTPLKAMYAENGDSEVNALYKDWASTEVDTTSAEYMLRVISTAKRLVASLGEFVKLQEQNHYVQGYALSYLEEFIRAINDPGYCESLSAISILPLMDVEPKAQAVKPGRKLPPIKKAKMLGHDDDHRVYSDFETWIMRCDNVEKIMMTLYVFFGGSSK